MLTPPGGKRQVARAFGVCLALAVALALRPYIAILTHSDIVAWKGVVGIPTCRPAAILIHHTGLPDRLGDRLVDIDFLDEVHRRRGYGIVFRWRIYHVGYHYLVLSSGEVLRGRPERAEGAHAGSLAANRTTIGVALAGDFTGVPPARSREESRPTEQQMDALVDLLVQLSQRYTIPASRILGHRDVDPATLCPGSHPDIPLLRRAVERQAAMRSGN